MSNFTNWNFMPSPSARYRNAQRLAEHTMSLLTSSSLPPIQSTTVVTTIGEIPLEHDDVKTETAQTAQEPTWKNVTTPILPDIDSSDRQEPPDDPIMKSPFVVVTPRKKNALSDNVKAAPAPVSSDKPSHTEERLPKTPSTVRKTSNAPTEFKSTATHNTQAKEQLQKTPPTVRKMSNSPTELNKKISNFPPTGDFISLNTKEKRPGKIHGKNKSSPASVLKKKKGRLQKSSLVQVPANITSQPGELKSTPTHSTQAKEVLQKTPPTSNAPIKLKPTPTTSHLKELLQKTPPTVRKTSNSPTELKKKSSNFPPTGDFISLDTKEKRPEKFQGKNKLSQRPTTVLKKRSDVCLDNKGRLQKSSPVPENIASQPGKLTRKTPSTSYIPYSKPATSYIPYSKPATSYIPYSKPAASNIPPGKPAASNIPPSELSTTTTPPSKSSTTTTISARNLSTTTTPPSKSSTSTIPPGNCSSSITKVEIQKQVKVGTKVRNNKRGFAQTKKFEVKKTTVTPPPPAEKIVPLNKKEPPRKKQKFSEAKVLNQAISDSVEQFFQSAPYSLTEARRRFMKDQRSSAIYEFSLQNQQSLDLLKKKEQLATALERVIRDRFLQHARIFLVGSSVNGFGGLQSDTDLCLVLDQGAERLTNRKRTLSALYTMRELLREVDFAKDLQVIPAKVPIIKFMDMLSGVGCDINVNNLTGIRNSVLLKSYCSLDHRVRPLVLVVKEWAHQNKINNASQGTLSSYSLVLMVINFLQCGVQPAVLPALQKDYPNLFSVKTPLPRIQECANRIAPFRSPNEMSLFDLLLKFFEYYAKRFDFEMEVMCVRLGTTRHIRYYRGLAKEWTKLIKIEEPFERSNTARAVHYDQTTTRRILTKFKNAYENLRAHKRLDKLIRVTGRSQDHVIVLDD